MYGPVRPAEVPLAAPSRRRWRLWTLLRPLFLIAAIPLILILILPILLIGQEITAPTWIKSRVEAQAESVLGGGSLSFDEITVTVGTDLHPIVRLHRAELRDAQGQLIARVPGIDALVSPRGLILEREVLPQEIRLTGAEVALLRNQDGSVAVAFDAGAVVAGQAPTFVELLRGVDAAFDVPSLAALESVRSEGMILNFTDARARRSWLVDGGLVTLDLRGDRLRLDGAFSVLSGRDFVTQLAMSYESPRGALEADLALNATDVLAADIATQSPALSFLSLLDAKVSARLRLRIDADGALGPLSATLEGGQGALRPEVGAEPVPFEAAKAYLRYEPHRGMIVFEQVEIASDLGAVTAQGHAYLRDVTEAGWPQAMVGQFRLSDVSLALPGVSEQPIDLSRITTDARLRFSPFAVEVGHFAVTHGQGEDAVEITGRAEIGANRQGWSVSVDAGVPRLTPAQAMAVWPEGVIPRTRQWFERNWSAGEITALNAAFRLRPDGPPVWSMTHEFEAATVQFVRNLPPMERAYGTVTIHDRALTIALDQGQVTTAAGGQMDFAGSVFAIPQMGGREPPAEIAIVARGRITDVLSLLDQPPLEVMQRAERPVDFADGQAVVTGVVRLPLMDRVPPELIEYEVSADLRGVAARGLVPDRIIRSDRLTAFVDAGGLTLTGPVEIGGVRADVTWTQGFGPQSEGQSQVRAQVTLSPAALREFNIRLPDGMVSGEALADLQLDLRRGAAPEMRLTSDLRGIALRLPALGYAKPAGAGGLLEVIGRLGVEPQIERLVIEGPGLVARGDIDLGPGGAFERARFDELQVGGWLSAAVDLISRGEGRSPAVAVNGGTLDLRSATFGQGGGDGGPITVALDRLRVTDAITLTGLRGEFDAAGGFDGRFTARLNGEAPIEGVVAPVGDRLGLRVLSADAGAVLSAAEFLRGAVGGSFDLTLLPVAQPGSYDGTLAVTNLRVREAPALASLLDAISVVGLLQQLDGQGLSFTNVDARFRLTPDRVIVTEAAAIGPGLGISVDGQYLTAGRVMDLQGVISPLYLINGVGSILTRPGEGLFGFNFTLTGPVDQVSVGVNPLSVLTPGMFREIFRRPVPVLEGQ